MLSAIPFFDKSDNKAKNANKIRKCPKCGYVLEAFDLVCPLCDYVLSSENGVTGSLQDLIDDINKLEKKRGAVLNSFKTTMSKSKINPTDEKISSLVKNFIVPNNKEDIFQFMFLASANINADLISEKETKQNKSSKMLTDTWLDKFEQTYQKALLLFDKEEDIIKIKEIYNRKKTEIDSKTKRPFSFFRRK